MTAVSRPALSGLLETCLYVEDIGRSRAFYERVFGFAAMVAEDRIVAFNVAPSQTLILFKRGATTRPIPVGGGHIPPHDGGGPQHYAFAIPAEAYDDWKAHLAREGVAIESEVNWPKGGKSIYFLDPDGLVVELATPGLWGNY